VYTAVVVAAVLEKKDLNVNLGEPKLKVEMEWPTG
jgi:hypothetical protein